PAADADLHLANIGRNQQGPPGRVRRDSDIDDSDSDARRMLGAGGVSSHLGFSQHPHRQTLLATARDPSRAGDLSRDGGGDGADRVERLAPYSALPPD